MWHHTVASCNMYGVGSTYRESGIFVLSDSLHLIFSLVLTHDVNSQARTNEYMLAKDFRILQICHDTLHLERNC
jgi:hypothetical protein